MSLILRLNEFNFESEVFASPVPVIVDFHADWCGPCRQMAPILEELAGETVGKLKIGKVNTDENKSLTAAYRIEALPTLILFDAGKPSRRLVGVRAKSEMLDAIARTFPSLRLSN